jgi:3'(2'), 5'-bisphosphate nucleotidase
MTRTETEQLVDIARRAALVISEVYQAPFDVEYKGPNDPVTAADRRANDLICSELERVYPGVPVVAEESEPKSFANFRAEPRVFFVDPLDGTREFVARNGEFVVMIGLVEGDRATIGVVHAPATDTTWVGVVGEGAYRLVAGSDRTPLGVSSVGELADSTLVISRSHRTAAVEAAARAVGARDVISIGSAGLKGAHVAQGKAEGYVAPNYAGKRWDACAVDALITAAGGRFSDAYGDAIDYRGPSLGNDRGVVGSNGHVHGALLERIALARAGASDET